MTLKFRKQIIGNEVLDGDGFYVSYIAAPKMPGLNVLLEIATGDKIKAGEETALKICQGFKAGWYILSGDYRAEYLEAFPGGVEACLAVYEKYKAENRSPWSTDDSLGECIQ